MIKVYNTAHLNLYKRYRDILDTTITIICKSTTGSKDPVVFKIKAVPNSTEFFDKILNDTTGEVTFFIEELEKLVSLSGTEKFPINDIEKQIDKVRYGDISYSVLRTRKNIFGNLIVFELSRKL